jgi:copper chaperone
MMEWKVDNIKCGGCAGRIRQQLLSLVGVSDVQVDVEQGVVRVEADADQFPAILARLKRLGYPLTGTTSGLAAVEADVRSVVSCAIGRLQSDA